MRPDRPVIGDVRGPAVGTLVVCVAALACACAGPPDVLTVSGSAVGAEGDLLARQVARYADANPGITVRIRPTPDAADQRHQLYVQWLNAWATDPDILQLDVIWTPEFAAAGWILPLDGLTTNDDRADFFDAPVDAARWRGRLYARPWFVDTGMLYWRTDLMPAPPETFDELASLARAAIDQGAVTQGFVWQGARYEGLVTVFVEYLAGFGGAILDADGRVVVDSPAAVRALTSMRDAIARDGVTPAAVLTWQEEQTRFAFQNGRAAFMPNWPYAAALLSRPGESAIAGRFGVAAMPREAGRSAAALGGAQLAINAHSTQPMEAWQLIQFLTAPEQMIERAQVTGQFPSRRGVYQDERLHAALPIPAEQVRGLIERAVPRPVTPVYTQLSGLLQIHLHRALTGQETPADALNAAAAAMRLLLATTGLSGPEGTS
jgi:multiple sugar transport system substrate-binding protein